jgi:predicted CXXCH cytochrome family protein
MKIVILLFILINTSFAAGIVGSRHDFSSRTWSEGEVCKACHIPHNANSTVDAPLWDHTITTQTFTPYTSTTMKAVAGQPDGISKLCLSCHDGTIAVDSFAGLAGGSQRIGNVIGPNLKSGQGHWKHPISITYNTDLSIADTRVYDPSVRTVSIGGTIKTAMLVNDKLQCSSCHDVHNKSGLTKLLRINGDNLCLACHKTKP